MNMLTPQEENALNLIDDDELIGWIQELSRINSVWRPQEGLGEEEAARWVAKRCLEIGLETHFEMVQPGRPNVIALLNGQGPGPTLMFEGHTDVVTAGDPADWTYPPFSATLKDGKIYGRGANDMKAGLVCALIATKALKESGLKLNGRILIGAVCDEEGEMIGIKHFVDQGWADDVDAAIICEPEENHLCITQKGVMWLKVTITGVMSHGAMPLTGVNSAYPMAKFLTLVQSLEEREIAQHGRDKYLGQPSITPTILNSPIAGEAQKNVMPGGTQTILDFRLIPGQNPEQLVEQVNQILAGVMSVDGRLTGTVEQLELRHPTKTAEEEPVVTTLASAFEDLSGTAPIYGGVPGSTDGTILNARKGIPIVTCGPGDIYIPHHIDEWVSVSEIKMAARMYVLAAIRYCGIATIAA
ncbi:MAG: succinyl-diaminopimelate desuccinylase [Cellvibrionaceae bacterium]|jgi:succinyl-diaminopimelate desuccinylase